MKLLTTLLFAGLFLFAIVLLVVIIVAWPPKMGLDFAGGVRMVYEVDRDAMEADEELDFTAADMAISDLVLALARRINPSGAKEVIVRRYAEGQVEMAL